MELAQFTPRNSLPLPLFFGSAEKVADQVQHWYEQGAMDMLRLRKDHPHGLRDFIDLVVPILQQRVIFRTGLCNSVHFPIECVPSISCK